MAKKPNRDSSLKNYEAAMVVGAVVALAVAEIARRKMHRDSYLDYLRPAPAGSPESSRVAEGTVPRRPVRGAADRAWGAVAASARDDYSWLRRVRAGAPRPGAAPPPPDAPSSAT